MTAHRTALAALLLATLAACNPTGTDRAGDAPAKPAGGPTATKAPATNDSLTLKQAVAKIPGSTEHPNGYDRDAFHLWTDADHDQCDTRQEVLLAEAVKNPTRGDDCKLTGGSWLSYYDEKTVTDPRDLDIDHVVPLAEAWASGASEWTVDRREAYANDLSAPRTLVAVTAHTNRSKGDQDPAEWLPPAASAQCTYAADWTAAKLRWHLTTDAAEQAALTKIANDCPDTKVEYKVAP